MREACDLVFRLAHTLARLGERDSDVAKFNAVLLVTIVEVFVLLATAIWIEVLGGPRLLVGLSKPAIVAGYVIVLTVNYFVVFRGDRTDRFEERFLTWTPRQRRHGMVLAAMIVVGLLIFIVLAYVALALNGAKAAVTP